MTWIAHSRLLFAPALLGYALSGEAMARSHYCATYYSDAQPEDCSFTSLQMCQASVSGLGGWCAPQSLAPVMAPAPLLQFPNDAGSALSPLPWYAFPPAPVPPPPQMGQPAAGPLQLPDAQNGN